MTEQSLAQLLPAIDIAAFARSRDGTFTPVAPPPPWFRRLADVTFPFLGHILDEANEFWGGGTPGCREWGPCAEVDEEGAGFHYKVIAVTAPGTQYLLFQLDHGSDRLQETLQKVRDERLAIEQSGRMLMTITLEARRVAAELRDVVKERAVARERRAEDEWLAMVSGRSMDLVMRLDQLTRVLQQAGGL